MTLELKKPSFSSNAVKNSSFDVEYDSNHDFDFQEVIAKASKRRQNSVLSPSEKKSSDSGFSEKRQTNMTDRYSDDYDSYDDDFEAEDSSPRRDRRYNSRYSTRTRTPDISPKRRTRRASRRDSVASYRSAYGNYRGSSRTNFKTKPKKSHSSANSRQGGSKIAGSSSLVHRVLSANRHKVSKLNNIVEDLEREVSGLKDENKTLKRVHHRQEKEIRKIDVEEASLPLILQRHSAEVRNLRERLKRSQEVVGKKEREARDRDDEIFKLRDSLKRYKELAAHKNLDERDSLAKKLDSIEQSLGERDRKILELEKAMTLKEKMRQRELKEQRDRYKQAREELKRLQQDFQLLREKLQEKERELDVKNIYHQHIIHKKKQVPLALPAGTAQLEENKNKLSEDNKPKENIEKTKNIFLTNASDSSSIATNDLNETTARDELELPSKSVSKSSGENPIVLRQAALTNSNGEFNASKIVEQERVRKEREETQRRLEDERRKREEEKRREEEERRRREEEERERERQAVEERRRKELEEQLRKQREEEQLRKEKEELTVDRKRQQEEEEIRKRKDLLLARMRMIDETTTKPNGIVDTGLLDHSGDNKPKKLPIFLQSGSNKEQEKPKDFQRRDDNFSSSGNLKKTSAGSSGRSSTHYEFKQSYENLHQGLPAHPSEGHIRNKGILHDSFKKSEEDLTFGSYKPSVATVRRRGARNSSNDGNEASHAPSFGDNKKKDTSRSGSGLDFSSKKNVTSEASQEKEQKTTFGDYNPSFATTSKRNEVSRPDENIFGLGGNKPPRGRRLRDENKASLFGSDILNDSESKPVNKGNSFFGDDPFASAGNDNINKSKKYPWENKVEIGSNPNERDSFENALLPRRKRIQAAPQPEKRAVSNALDNTIDDDIEEVIL